MLDAKILLGIARMGMDVNLDNLGHQGTVFSTILQGKCK
jgi:hypothetical protein